MTKLTSLGSKYFVEHNQNPFNKRTTDCAIRAISKYLNKDYIEVVRDFFEITCKTGLNQCDSKVITKYLKQCNCIKMKEPRDSRNKKYMVREFLKFNPNLSCVANVGSHHMVAIIDGKVYDTFNSSWSIMHSYWVLS